MKEAFEMGILLGFFIARGLVVGILISVLLVGFMLLVHH